MNLGMRIPDPQFPSQVQGRHGVLQQVGLGQDDMVGDRELGRRLAVGTDGFKSMEGVDRGDDARKPETSGDRGIPAYGVDDGARVGKPRSLYDDAFEMR